ncbi:ABC transporter substrate-binding protein [Vibrio kasasachensis]|uniref:ABC transporter substrate-binding protein n=1 Tax=Vibrio kasasachensis TaxID=2910248 RepID=UPI003D0E453A
MKRVILSVLVLITSLTAQGETAEFLHWWTSQGERQALAELQAEFLEQGIELESSPVFGGGGDTAMTVLQARAIAGNPPEIALVEGLGIQSWATLGFVRDLHSVVTEKNWAQRFPRMAVDINTFQQRFVAAPLNIHRVNWLWVNKPILDRYDLTPPTTWQAFFPIAEKLKAEGIPALAIGNEPWQLSILFESLALGLYGSDYYRELFIEFDQALAANQKTVDLFKTFRRLKPYMLVSNNALSWEQATKQLMQQQAAMQLQGDWVKGDLTAMGYKPQVDYYCLPAPGTANTFIYNIDSLVLFRQGTDASQEMVQKLASVIVSPDFQVRFNQKKGSIPILRNVDMSSFDDCAKTAKQQFDYAEQHDSLLPSISDSMAVAPELQEAMLALISHYFNDDAYTEKEAIKQLLKIAASVGFTNLDK